MKQNIRIRIFIYMILAAVLIFNPINIVDAQVGVIRGAGYPVVDVIVSPTYRVINENDVETMIINVKNIGDDDGFNVILNSKNGKLIFTPSSWTNTYIPAGTEKRFEVRISRGPRDVNPETYSYVSSANDVINLVVSANHNEEKVIKNFNMDISYLFDEVPKTSGYQIISSIIAIFIIYITIRKL